MAVFCIVLITVVIVDLILWEYMDIHLLHSIDGEMFRVGLVGWPTSSKKENFLIAQRTMSTFLHNTPRRLECLPIQQENGFSEMDSTYFDSPCWTRRAVRRPLRNNCSRLWAGLHTWIKYTLQILFFFNPLPNLTASAETYHILGQCQ